jgi:hypothetical protein
LARPHLVARLRVERDDLAVELALEHHPVAHRDAAVQPAATDGADLVVQIRLVLPKDLPARDIDGEHVVRAGRDVEDAVVDHGLALTGVLRRGA